MWRCGEGNSIIAALIFSARARARAPAIPAGPFVEGGEKKRAQKERERKREKKDEVLSRIENTPEAEGGQRALVLDDDVTD